MHTGKHPAVSAVKLGEKRWLWYHGNNNYLWESTSGISWWLCYWLPMWRWIGLSSLLGLSPIIFKTWMQNLTMSKITSPSNMLASILLKVGCQNKTKVIHDFSYLGFRYIKDWLLFKWVQFDLWGQNLPSKSKHLINWIKWCNELKN